MNITFAHFIYIFLVSAIRFFEYFIGSLLWILHIYASYVLLYIYCVFLLEFLVTGYAEILRSVWNKRWNWWSVNGSWYDADTLFQDHILTGNSTFHILYFIGQRKFFTFCVCQKCYLTNKSVTNAALWNA